MPSALNADTDRHWSPPNVHLTITQGLPQEKRLEGSQTRTEGSEQGKG